MTNFYLARMLPESLPASLDWRVLAFAVVLTGVVGLLIGLIPMVHIFRTNLASVLQKSSRSATSSRAVHALSGVLVVAQVSVALMLLTGAGLLIHSFAKAVKVDTGLEPSNVVTARIALTRQHRASDEAVVSIRDRLLQAMKEIPGVTSVALAAATPFQGDLPINAFTLENDTLPPGAPQPGAFRVIVSPGYAETLGLKLVQDRFYEEADLPRTGATSSSIRASRGSSFRKGLPSVEGSPSAAGRKNPKNGRRSSGSSRTCRITGSRRKAATRSSISSCEEDIRAA